MGSRVGTRQKQRGNREKKKRGSRKREASRGLLYTQPLTANTPMDRHFFCMKAKKTKEEKKKRKLIND
jgi:hypothetical protein